MKRLPPSTRPYLLLARLDKPIGTYLLLWPSWWSIALAADSGLAHLPWTNLGLFGLGAVLLRGAGCTINDIWDRDLDRSVARTKHRPVASGAVSVPMALGFLGMIGVAWTFGGWLVFGAGMTTWGLALIVRNLR